MQSNLIFISSPYSHPDKSVQESRYELICELASILINKGEYPISPIINGHPTTKYGVRGDWEFWSNYCIEILSVCQKVYVVDLDGWQESTGVKYEIDLAKSLDKEVYLINNKNGEVITKI